MNDRSWLIDTYLSIFCITSICNMEPKLGPPDRNFLVGHGPFRNELGKSYLRTSRHCAKFYSLLLSVQGTSFYLLLTIRVNSHCSSRMTFSLCTYRSRAYLVLLRLLRLLDVRNKTISTSSGLTITLSGIFISWFADSTRRLYLGNDLDQDVSPLARS